MRFIALSTLTTLALSGAWADVTYSVVAFPQGNQGVSVSVGGNVVALQKSTVHPNIYSGSAPAGDNYQYVLTDGANNTPESTTRKLAQGATSTGNEFFNRTQTIYNIPHLPQAYNPIYPSKYFISFIIISLLIFWIFYSFDDQHEQIQRSCNHYHER